MKIVLVSTDFLPNIGGVAQHIVEIAKALIEMGDSVEVIAPFYSQKWGDFNKTPFGEEQLGIPIWRIPFVVNTSIRLISGQLSSRISDRCFRTNLRKRLNESKIDVVHWHALESRGHPLSSWNKSARVWTNHTSQFIVGLDSRRRVHYKKEAAIADEIIAPSEELCELTRSLGINSERVHFIPNGVDCRRFTPEVDTREWRKRLSLGTDGRLILCPRRLERKNGVSYFIKAAISLLEQGQSDVRFAVAGNFAGPRSDSEEDTVSKMIADSPFADRIRLLGRIENNEMPGLYACSYLVVMPSLMEATSLSAMEAMACGKAVVSTDVGGLPFLVRHNENGLLLPAKNVDRMAQAIKVLLDDPEKVLRFGKQGRERVKRDLDWSAIAAATKAVYRKAVVRYSSSEAQGA